MAKTPKATTTPTTSPAPGSHIVSSAHLVSPQSAEMSEFEFGLIVASNAFHRWVVHCMAAAGLKDLMPLDVLVLHHVSHRARDKRLSDICFIMNIEDTHLVNYSLKKLVSLGVVASSKSGKEVTYAATEAGSVSVQRYREIREQCLIQALHADDRTEQGHRRARAPAARALGHVRPGGAVRGVAVNTLPRLLALGDSAWTLEFAAPSIPPSTPA